MCEELNCNIQFYFRCAFCLDLFRAMCDSERDMWLLKEVRAALCSQAPDKIAELEAQITLEAPRLCQEGLCNYLVILVVC